MRTVLAALAFTSAAFAAPNEIKVFTDELAAYREHTLETHFNKADTGPWRLMPEYSYGLAPNWEVSLQLPFAFQSSGATSEGYRVELQYVAPHDAERGFYWGFNAELARQTRVNEEEFSNAELIVILGYRVAKWHMVLNPGWERPIGDTHGATSATPAAKVAYATSDHNSFGFEYYRDAQSKAIYFAWDGQIGKSSINVGLGRGLTSESDRWVLKAIYEIAF